MRSGVRGTGTRLLGEEGYELGFEERGENGGRSEGGGRPGSAAGRGEGVRWEELWTIES